MANSDEAPSVKDSLSAHLMTFFFFFGKKKEEISSVANACAE